MKSTWVAPFTDGYADFYSWDGSFVRRVAAAGNLIASIDGRYFVNFTKGQLMDSNGTLVRSFTEPTLAQGSTALNWARDGDYFCGLEQTSAGFSMVVEDVSGNDQRIALDVPADLVPPDGLAAMEIECSLTTNRAIIFGQVPGHPRVGLMSLPDGHLISDFGFDSGFFGNATSSDLRWLAANSTSANGSTTEVIDTSNGTVAAKIDGYFWVFMPDGEQLAGDDVKDVATVVDWQSGTAIWTGPGHLDTWVAQSDPSTNRTLLWLSTGSAQAGTETYDYWIVDGTGAGFRFNPGDCASIAVSPARVCSFI